MKTGNNRRKKKSSNGGGGGAEQQHDQRRKLMLSLCRMSHPLLVPREPILRALDLLETDPVVRAALGFLKDRLFKQGIVIQERTEMFKGLKKEAFHQFVNRRYIPYCKQRIDSRLAAGFCATTWRPHDRYGGYPVCLDLRRVQPVAQFNAVGEICMTYFPVSTVNGSTPSTIGSWTEYSPALYTAIGDEQRQHQKKDKRGGGEEDPWFRTPPSIFTDFFDGPRSDSGLPVSAILALEDDAMFDKMIRQLTLKSFYDRSNQLIVYKKGNSPNGDILSSLATVANAISPGCPDAATRAMLSMGGGASSSASASAAGGMGGRLATGVRLTSRTEEQTRRANVARIDAWCRTNGIDPQRFMAFFNGQGGPDSGVRFLPLGENQHLEKTPNPPDPPDYLSFQSAREERVGAVFRIPRMLWTHASLNRKHKTTQTGGEDSADQIFASTLLDHATSCANGCSKVYHRIYKLQHQILRDGEYAEVVGKRRRTGKEKKRQKRVSKRKEKKETGKKEETAVFQAASHNEDEEEEEDEEEADNECDEDDDETVTTAASEIVDLDSKEEEENEDEDEDADGEESVVGEDDDDDVEEEEESDGGDEEFDESSSNKRRRVDSFDSQQQPRALPKWLRDSYPMEEEEEEEEPTALSSSVIAAAAANNPQMSKSKKRRERLKRKRYHLSSTNDDNSEDTIRDKLNEVMGVSPLFGLGSGLAPNHQARTIQRQFADSDNDDDDNDENNNHSDGDDDRKDEETFNESIRATFSFPSVIDFMAVQKLYDDGLLKYESYKESVSREFSIPEGYMVEAPPLLNNEQKREVALQEQLTEMELSKDLQLKQTEFQQQQKLQEQQFDATSEENEKKNKLQLTLKESESKTAAAVAKPKTKAKPKAKPKPAAKKKTAATTTTTTTTKKKKAKPATAAAATKKKTPAAQSKFSQGGNGKQKIGSAATVNSQRKKVLLSKKKHGKGIRSLQTTTNRERQRRNDHWTNDEINID